MYAVRTNKKNKKEVRIRCTQNYYGLPQLTFSSNLDFLICGPVLLEVLLNLVEFNSIQFVYTTTTMVLSSYEMNFRFLSPPPTISQLSFHTVRLTFPLSVEKIPARILPKIKPISLSLFPGVAFLFCKEIYLFFLGNFEKNITPLSVHSKRKSFSLKNKLSPVDELLVHFGIFSSIYFWKCNKWTKKRSIQTNWQSFWKDKLQKTERDEKLIFFLFSCCLAFAECDRNL